MKDQSNQGFWRRTAKLYGPAMDRSGELYGDICREIRRSLTEEMDVLELACGTGQLSFPLAGAVRSWKATDFTPEMVREAAARPGPPQLHFAVADATALREPDGSYDAVVIANALHIMPRPDLALAEIRRVLRPGGILFAPTFIDGKGAKFRLRSIIMKLAGFRVFHSWNQKEFWDYIEARGFAVTACQRMGEEWMPLCYLEAEADGL